MISNESTKLQPQSRQGHSVLPGSLEVDAADTTQRRRQQLMALLRGRWKWVILIALLLGPTLAGAAWVYVSPEYVSRGVVHVSPDLQRILSETDSTRPMPRYPSFLEGQPERIRSEPIIRDAMRHEDWQKLGRDTSSFEAVEQFNSGLTITPEPRKQQLLISYRDKSPDAAKAGINAIMEAYQRFYARQADQRDDVAVGKLEQRRSTLQREIQRKRGQRAELIRESGGAGLTQRLKHTQQTLWQLESAKRLTERQIQAAQAIERGETPTVSTQSIHEIAQRDPHMRQLMNRRQQFQAQIQRGTEMGLGRNHRQMRSARADLDTINRRIENYVQNYREGGAPIAGQPGDPQAGNARTANAARLMLSPEQLRVRMKDLTEREQELKSQLASLSEKQLQVNQIEQNLTQLQSRLRSVEARLDEIEFEPSEAERIDIVQGGNTAELANGGTRKQLAAVGLVGGGGMGLGFVLLAGLLDRRFRRIDDAELTFPTTRMLGILPTLPPKMTDSEHAAIGAHCVHHIRTLMQLGGGAQQSKVFTVTSPGPGSGKTSLATALGVSFANSGNRTLLIDCDVVGAGLTRRLGLTVHRSLEDVLRREGMVSEQALAEARRSAEASHKRLDRVLVEMGYLETDDMQRALQMQQDTSLGLFDACEGEPFEHCLTPTDVEGLSLLPVGAATPQQAGSLAPSGLARLLETARARFDTVLIDTGPVLGSIEASMTAAEADGVVLVVSRGDQKTMVTKSLSHLQQIDAPLTGVVFNHASAQDVQRSSYASVTSAAPEGSDPRTSRPVDETTWRRYGPIGSAVCSFSQSRQRDTATVHAGNSNGHGYDEDDNGHATQADQ